MNKIAKQQHRTYFLHFSLMWVLGLWGAGIGVGFSIRRGLLLAFLACMDLSEQALVLALEEVLVSA